MTIRRTTLFRNVGIINHKTMFPSPLCRQLIQRSLQSLPIQTGAQFHTTNSCLEIRKLARLRVVDNSKIGKQAMAEGKPPRVIHVYNKRCVGMIGDRVLVAIKGEKKKGILVGLKQVQKPKVPKFDSNNVVLIDDDGTPLGTRIHVPIPTIIRTKMKQMNHEKNVDYTKLLAIATRFV